MVYGGTISGTDFGHIIIWNPKINSTIKSKHISQITFFCFQNALAPRHPQIAKK